MNKKLSKIILIFLLAIAAGTFLFPQPTHALIGTGLFDYFDTALNGVEELASPVDSALIKTTIMYVVSFVVFAFSEKSLSFAMENTSNWLNFSSMDGVRAGWEFTAGLSNLLLIIIFVVVAFGFILNIDKLKVKQSLPRLIIVALLINFSWFLVGLVTDLTTILYNALNMHVDLSIWSAFFTESFGSNISALLTTLGTSIISYAVPFIGPFLQIAVVTGLGYIFFPEFLSIGASIITLFVMGGIFLIYAFLFIARVFVLYILMVLSPIALLMFILPQTENWWKTWLNTLIEWLLLGVYLIFFLLIGQVIFSYAFQQDWIDTLNIEPIKIGDIGVFYLPDYTFFYLFLFVYLFVVLIIINKTLPKDAVQMLDYAKGAATRGAQAIRTSISGGTKRYLESSERMERKAEQEKDGELLTQRLGAYDTLQSFRQNYTKKPVKTYTQRSRDEEKKAFKDLGINKLDDLQNEATLSMARIQGFDKVIPQAIEKFGPDKFSIWLANNDRQRDEFDRYVTSSNNTRLKERYAVTNYTGDNDTNKETNRRLGISPRIPPSEVISRQGRYVNSDVAKNNAYAETIIRGWDPDALKDKSKESRVFTKDLKSYIKGAGKDIVSDLRRDNYSQYKTIMASPVFATTEEKLNDLEDQVKEQNERNNE